MSWKDAYIESQVMTADPLELVRMLYQAAIDSIADARIHLAAGNIAARSKSITRAQAIVAELSGSLDQNAGEISRNLAALYDYVRQRLTEGNLSQKDAPLAEAEGLLTTVHEAWQRTSPSEPVASALPIAPVWVDPSAVGAHMWSA